MGFTSFFAREEYLQLTNMIEFTENRRIFASFFLFGLLNNILYVIILSAAVDLVGHATPKALVLLADIVPALVVKILAPFFIHLIPYTIRIWVLVALSTSGMLAISFFPSVGWKLFGICLASMSSGGGETTFLQLTHFYHKKMAVGGFSTGTGGAGLLGSGYFMLMTNILQIKVPLVLMISAMMPWGFIAAYYKVLPGHSDNESYMALNEGPDESSVDITPEYEDQFSVEETDVKWNSKQHLTHTMHKIGPLVVPYMTPLCLVYISEYVINQGISPTLLFPLEELPRWLFRSYRDIYVVYGFLYQLGVFISRSSVNFGVRIRHLYVMAGLQFLNVVITLSQSLYDFPFSRIWFLLVLVLYEGLLGGLSYINTFMLVSEEVPAHRREFSMGCVTISDSLGVMIAGCINYVLETQLCNAQVNRGREWCRTG